VGVERGSAGCLSFAALPRSNFLLFQKVQKEAVLTEIQNRLDPHPNPPPGHGGGSKKRSAQNKWESRPETLIQY
jgi:hypothetical protein